MSLGVRFLDEVVDMPVIVHVVFFVLKTVCRRPCDHAETWFAFSSWEGR